MLSSNSLTAFSNSLAQTGVGPSSVAPSSIGPLSGIARVRETGSLTQSKATPPKLVQPDPAGSAPPSRTLPRGSLLDLSV